MFDKLKQAGDLLKLRSQAMELQKKLDQVVISHTKGNVKVKITGSQKIDYIEVDGVARDDIKDAINDAMKEVQKEAARKMMEEGGGLSGLLGGLGK